MKEFVELSWKIVVYVGIILMCVCRRLCDSCTLSDGDLCHSCTRAVNDCETVS